MQVIRIGETRGRRQLWIEGELLVSAGFAAGDAYQLTTSAGRIELRRASSGRHISSRRGRLVVNVNSDVALRATGSRVFKVQESGGGVLVLLSAE